MSVFETKTLVYSRSTSYTSGYIKVLVPSSALAKAAVSFIGFGELHL